MNLASIVPHSRATYQITVRGTLGRSQSAWFGPAQLRTNSDGTTTLTLEVSDQSALHGVLSHIRDLSLVLITVYLLDYEPM